MTTNGQPRLVPPPLRSNPRAPSRFEPQLSSTTSLASLLPPRTDAASALRLHFREMRQRAPAALAAPGTVSPARAASSAAAAAARPGTAAASLAWLPPRVSPPIEPPRPQTAPTRGKAASAPRCASPDACYIPSTSFSFTGGQSVYTPTAVPARTRYALSVQMDAPVQQQRKAHDQSRTSSSRTWDPLTGRPIEARATPTKPCQTGHPPSRRGATPLTVCSHGQRTR